MWKVYSQGETCWEYRNAFWGCHNVIMPSGPTGLLWRLGIFSIGVRTLFLHPLIDCGLLPTHNHHVSYQSTLRAWSLPLPWDPPDTDLISPFFLCLLTLNWFCWDHVIVHVEGLGTQREACVTDRALSFMWPTGMHLTIRGHTYSSPWQLYQN